MGVFSDVANVFGAENAWGDTDRERQQQKDLYDNLQQEGSAAYNGAQRPNLVGQSQFTNMSTDPRTRQYQMEALKSLSGLANANGMDPQAMASLYQGQSLAAGQEKSQRDAIGNDLRARGMGGGGAEVAQLMAAQQGGANRSAATSREAAADARTRALQAMGDMANVASGVRNQDWGEASQRATAMDKNAEFNANQNDEAMNRLLQAYGLNIKGADSENNYLNEIQKKKVGKTMGEWGDFGNFGDSIAGSAAGGGGGGMPGGGGGSYGGGGGGTYV